jgi:hypothetical protein
MSEVRLLVPNDVAEDFKSMTDDDLKRVMSSYYYNDYRTGKRSLSNIAEKIGISVYELVDVYGAMEVPLIVGDVNDYIAELQELETIL